MTHSPNRYKIVLIMETFNKTEIIKRLQRQNFSLFTLSDFARLFAINNKNTLYKKIQRLEKEGIVKRLIKGKYLFLLQKANEFMIANFLYQPSYISLESALSLYGIITGFPYKITSITTKKSKTFVIDEKEYQYSQINKSLFWGYEKKEDFLIAEKEKALIDYLYLVFKGLRTLDVDEFELSSINKKKLKEYFKKIANKDFSNFLKKQKI